MHSLFSRPRFHFMLALGLILIPATMSAYAAVTQSPLEVAQALGNDKFSDWTYGNQQSNKQIDCTNFVIEVAQEYLSKTFNSTWRNEINIANISELDSLSGEARKAKLAQLIMNEVDRTKGIQHAMVSRGLGTAVNSSDIAPGDFVQYWIKGSSGWFGHAAIVEHVYEKGGKSRMKLYGSHLSINGVGSSLDKNDIILFHNDDSRKIYAVRMH